MKKTLFKQKLEPNSTRPHKLRFKTVKLFCMIWFDLPNFRVFQLCIPILHSKFTWDKFSNLCNLSIQHSVKKGRFN